MGGVADLEAQLHHAVVPVAHEVVHHCPRQKCRLLRAPRAQTNAPLKTDSLWRTRTALQHPGRPQTVEDGVLGVGGAAEARPVGRGPNVWELARVDLFVQPQAAVSISGLRKGF
jgi:hypothetical protein